MPNMLNDKKNEIFNRLKPIIFVAGAIVLFGFLVHAPATEEQIKQLVTTKAVFAEIKEKDILISFETERKADKDIPYKKIDYDIDFLYPKEEILKCLAKKTKQECLEDLKILISKHKTFLIDKEVKEAVKELTPKVEETQFSITAEDLMKIAND